MEEQWKKIESCPLYAVSTMGRVKNRATNRILTQSIQSSGNAIVCLSNNGRVKTYSVCRLMMEAFKPVDDMDNMVVKHKDANKCNNSLDNLEWSNNNKYYTRKPNEVNELKQTIKSYIDKAIEDWYKKYNPQE